MNIRQRALYLLLGIAIGYIYHDFAYDRNQNILKRIHFISNKSAQQTVLGDVSDDQFITSVVYTGGRFEPRTARVRKGNYVVVANTSKTSLLWLQSDMPGVMTTRGYAEGEQFQFTAPDPGVYTITNKLDSRASFRLTVSP